MSSLVSFSRPFAEVRDSLQEMGENEKSYFSSIVYEVKPERIRCHHFYLLLRSFFQNIKMMSLDPFAIFSVGSKILVCNK